MRDEMEARHRTLCEEGWTRRGFMDVGAHRAYYCDGFRDGQAAEHERAERLATALRALVDGATAVIGLDGDWTNLLVATEALEAARAALAGDAPGRGETR